LNDEIIFYGCRHYIFLTQRGAEVYAEGAEGVIGLDLDVYEVGFLLVGEYDK
jgi:hypothetical protein